MPALAQQNYNKIPDPYPREHKTTDNKRIHNEHNCCR